MTEQQSHLQSALTQQKQIAEKIGSLNNKLSIEREKFIKFQGIVEYLTNIGVTLPQENLEEQVDSTSPEEVVEE